jgi:spermidine synthase
VSFGALSLVAIVSTVQWRIVDELIPSSSTSKKILHRDRNFYGTVRVQQRSIGDADENITFYSGHIQHGKQLTNPAVRRTPLTYYGKGSGCELALNYLNAKSKQNHYGIVGLGVGTLATYAREGDKIRFYEINPQVLHIAQNTQWFHFLSDCPAEKQIVLGDARLQLERELQANSHQFDFLCIDAFSGDAIPAHLLTNEAFTVYKQHLKPDGILAIHITNTYLDLFPVVKRLAETHGFQFTRIAKAADVENQLYANDYMLLTNNSEFLARTPSDVADLPRFKSRVREVPLWTDEYNNLMQLLR